MDRLVADVHLDREHATREEAWDAIVRHWAQEHERRRRKEWKRLQGGR
jgi:hypothetical protein